MNGGRVDSFGLTLLTPYRRNSKSSPYVENLRRSYEPARSVLIRERNTTGGITLPAATVNFGVEGRPTPFGTAAAIDVIAPLTCSSELRCPGLRIDAGGAVRLCGNQLSCT